MKAAESASTPPLGVPPDTVARLRTVNQLDPGTFLDVVPNTMSAAGDRVRAVLGEDAESEASAAVGAFLVDILLRTPPEEIIRRGGAPSAFAHIVEELRTHPAGHPDVERVLRAIDRRPEGLEQ
jgi:hypothetical protein